MIWGVTNLHPTHSRHSHCHPLLYPVHVGVPHSIMYYLNAHHKLHPHFIMLWTPALGVHSTHNSSTNGTII